MSEVIYASVSDLQDYLPATRGVQPQTSAIERLLIRASRAIDSYCRRESGAFAPASEDASARVVYGGGESTLRTPPFVAGTVATVTAPAQVTVPLFTEVGGRIVTRDSRGFLSALDVWQTGAPYTVAARWGYAVTPPDITEACLQLAVRWWRAKDEAFSGVIGGIRTDGSIVEKDFPAAVKTLLDPYRITEQKIEPVEDQIGFGRITQTEFN